jgi:hypothetical protein
MLFSTCLTGQVSGGVKRTTMKVKAHEPSEALVARQMKAALKGLPASNLSELLEEKGKGPLETGEG